jgi:hypothetical protein
MSTTFTYTEVQTRTEAVVDQFDIFLAFAGINEESRTAILRGVNARWLEAVGVFLVRQGRRVLEAEIRIDWTMYSDLAALTPTIRTDLPGWEGGGAPEVRTIGRRFGSRAAEMNVVPSYWVRFTETIRQDAARYAALCPEVGVSCTARPPEWAAGPRERSYNLLDLPEISTALREQ